MTTEGEVTIVCVANEVRLPDLKLFLTRGQKVTVPFSSSMRSRDLSQAKMDGTVTTQVMRASQIRPPVPPDVARVQELVSSNTTTSQAVRSNQKPQQPQEVDMSPVLGALHTLTDEVRALRRDMAQQPSPVPSLDLSPLIQAIQGLRIAGGPSTAEPVATVQNSLPSASEARFIPSSIVPTESTTNLEVSATETDGGSVDDVAAALKRAKTKR